MSEQVCNEDEEVEEEAAVLEQDGARSSPDSTLIRDAGVCRGRRTETALTAVSGAGE